MWFEGIKGVMDYVFEGGETKAAKVEAFGMCDGFGCLSGATGPQRMQESRWCMSGWLPWQPFWCSYTIRGDVCVIGELQIAS